MNLIQTIQSSMVDIKIINIVLLFIPAVFSQNPTYDFIIVGAGTAGCTLANRLSENPNWSILLIEAGGEPTPTFSVDTPYLTGSLQSTNLDWAYKIEPQSNAGLGMVNGSIAAPRGKGIGGSSLINYMVYTRGNKYDYDMWSSMGNQGWSYDEVLPYFKKLENSLIYNDDYPYRGHSGPVYASYIPFQTDSLAYFLSAAQDRGYPYVDYNGENQIGLSLLQTTTKDGKRWSAEKAYIRPIRSVRSNLFVLPNRRVLKILINSTTKATYGVQYLENSQTKTALAAKEVILSAGAYNSPQLLMLSGIGPANQLTPLGISVIKDSPVGQVLYDHTMFIGLLFRTCQFGSVISPLAYINPLVLAQYLLYGSGLLASCSGLEALTFLNTNVTTGTAERPDMELLYIGGSLQSDAGVTTRKTYNIDPQIYQSVWGIRTGQPIFQIMPTLLHPKSIGKVELKSGNPLDPPRIIGNFFTDNLENDKLTMLKGIREAQRIVDSPAYSSFGAQLVNYQLPGCTQYTFDSDNFWYCAMKYLTISLYHPSTTCKMGSSATADAVVDSTLKVYGVQNLRVIDASIMPTTISGHLNVPTFMVAEKGADLIKADWL